MSAGRVACGVLVSGRGSNLGALIAAARAADYPARIAVVIASRPDAPALDIARAAGIPAVALDHRAHATRAVFERAIDAALNDHGAQLVCLAGYMLILGDGFVRRWQGRMLNIHPSLLPRFRGLKPQAQALAAGVPISGCTVHFVEPELDAGPIVAQAAVPVLPGDDEAALSARILEAEHTLYPKALALVARGEAVYADGRVVFSGADQTRR